jgi:6-pyruvoyltetrahydropterin/6-carboxytetrahydropterin synthase
VFESKFLDSRNWVFDFGAYRVIREELFRVFDHALVVAQDDPALPDLRRLGEKGVARIVEVPAVGCEAFAKLILHKTEELLRENFPELTGVRVVQVTVREHEANAATYEA